MRKKPLVILILVGLAAVAGIWSLAGTPGSNPAAYEFDTVSRGDIENTVSAIGTVTPVTTVEVGTQVSGTIDSVFVDFNDTVRRRQILAVLDTSLLMAAVMDAEANIERAEAQVDQAEAEHARQQALFDQKLISEAELLPYQIALRTQRASLKSAQATLLRAQQNLDYAVIRSPIDGLVIGRNVEAGQTVAASLSTPTLFVIAQDLSRMEILSEVDECDIGQIVEGQAVRFEVAAYSDVEFSGIVRQLRLQPMTISNVVTYTVVVEAANQDNLLLPGMTATLEFVTDHRSDVLLVSNKALRFQPPVEIVQAFREKRRQEREAGAGDIQIGARGSGGGMMPGAGRRQPSNMTMVWYLDSTGQLAASPVRKGLSDGSQTEILFSRSLLEGSQVIVGTASENTSDQDRSNAGGTGFRPPPRGF